jgi:hypothetical protein
VFENRILRRIFGPKTNEVTGEWRKLYNEEFNDLYLSPSIVRVIKLKTMRCLGHIACMAEERGMYMVLVGKPEKMRPLARPRNRWEEDIKIDHKEVGCEGMDWIKLAQDRDRWWALLNVVINFRIQ